MPKRAADRRPADQQRDWHCDRGLVRPVPPRTARNAKTPRPLAVAIAELVQQHRSRVAPARCRMTVSRQFRYTSASDGELIYVTGSSYGFGIKGNDHSRKNSAGRCRR